MAIFRSRATIFGLLAGALLAGAMIVVAVAVILVPWKRAKASESSTETESAALVEESAG